METTQAERFSYMRTELLNLTQNELAQKLDIQPQLITNIESGRTERISPKILKLLVDEYLINLEWLLWGYGQPTKVDDHEYLEYKIEEAIKSGKNYSFDCGCYDVPYWEGLPDDLKRPQIDSVHSDLQLIATDWLSEPSNLRTMPMLGDSMNTYPVPLKNRNMLIIDTHITDINKSGVYLFTTNGGNNLYIRFLSLNMDGSVKITAYKNNEQISKTLTVEEQKEYDFKVIGRIIINASLTM